MWRLAMKRIAQLVLALAALASGPAWAGPMEEARATYDRFVAAQNARDLGKVRSLLLDSPRFLWVSDGQSIWGRDAMIERMASFQEAEVWRVDPALDKAVAVEVNADAAFLHLPLQLTIGSSASPDKLRFLVSVLCVRTPDGWRIAALFTTSEKLI
jgi:ketosteroid isomerase-like protein